MNYSTIVIAKKKGGRSVIKTIRREPTSCTRMVECNRAHLAWWDKVVEKKKKMRH